MSDLILPLLLVAAGSFAVPGIVAVVLVLSLKDGLA